MRTRSRCVDNEGKCTVFGVVGETVPEPGADGLDTELFEDEDE